MGFSRLRRSYCAGGIFKGHGFFTFIKTWVRISHSYFKLIQSCDTSYVIYSVLIRLSLEYCRQFYARKIRSHCWSGLMVIKHSSVRSVLILKNVPTRTRIKLDIGYWLTIFRVRVEKTKQNKYLKVLWPCGFTPYFGGSRQFYFCHIIFIYFFIYTCIFHWYWFDYVDCDLFCIFSLNIGVLSPYLHSELNGCYESPPP